MNFLSTIVSVDEFGIECFHNRELNEFFSARKDESPTKKHEIFLPQITKNILA